MRFSERCGAQTQTHTHTSDLTRNELNQRTWKNGASAIKQIALMGFHQAKWGLSKQHFLAELL